MLCQVTPPACHGYDAKAHAILLVSDPPYPNPLPPPPLGTSPLVFKVCVECVDFVKNFVQGITPGRRPRSWCQRYGAVQHYDRSLSSTLAACYSHHVSIVCWIPSLKQVYKLYRTWVLETAFPGRPVPSTPMGKLRCEPSWYHIFIIYATHIDIMVLMY